MKTDCNVIHRPANLLDCPSSAKRALNEPNGEYRPDADCHDQEAITKNRQQNRPQEVIQDRRLL